MPKRRSTRRSPFEKIGVDFSPLSIRWSSSRAPQGLYVALEQFVRKLHGHHVSIAEVAREVLQEFLMTQSTAR